MKIIRRKSESHSQLSSGTRTSPNTFFFYEKHTGVAHFHVEAGLDGTLPSDQAAGLLAMHCLVRGQSPSDYVVMVEAHPNLLGGIADMAEKLLKAGRTFAAPVQLSRREEEVLGGLMRSLSNKEIAASLNLSERTVKFHVSSLLSKFHVRGRMELVREASRACLPTRSASFAEQHVPFPPLTREAHAFPAPQPVLRPQAHSADVVSLAKRRISA